LIVNRFQEFCMAEFGVAFRYFLRATCCRKKWTRSVRRAAWLALPGLLAALPAHAQEAALAESAVTPGVAASATPMPAPPAPRWIAVPRASGRLRAADIGLVINTADAYSVEVGEHYIRSRSLLPTQVLRLELPVGPVLTVPEFERLQQAIHEFFGSAAQAQAQTQAQTQVQALALAWRAPYAVGCNSITGALALGFDAALCQNSCAPSRVSGYFNSASARPWADHGLRPAMLLAARSAESAKALIDRGVAADGRLALRAGPPVSALFLTTSDTARNVRARLYPPAGMQASVGVDMQVLAAERLQQIPRVLLALTGSARLSLTPAPDWMPGALADHLTSFGGALLASNGQDTALDWIESGVTASHGTVSEPCNHLQKFPHPQVLLLHYLQGSTAIEAYWKSVAWPQQALFVGEPLAAPFAPW
jgi:uncharacterized protein (TIGR03790 family)